MLFSKDKSIVGVDIGTSSIKLVQLDHDSAPVLKTYGIVDIPEPITTQSSPEVIRQIAGLLSSLLAKAHVSTKRCAMSLPNTAVFTSVVDMPKMSESELASAMPFEAKKYVPLPFSEISLSWTVIAEDHDQATNKVLLIAVPKQINETYVKIFEMAGLHLEVIEIEALALIRALVEGDGKNDVIIDMGAKVTGLNFVKDGVLQLTRNLNIGGDTITQRIAQALNVSVGRAEQFKRDFGLNGTDFLPESVKPVLGTIKNEVSQLIKIYQSHNIKVDRILLVGGGAQLPGIVDYFKDLGSPVFIGNPLSRVAYPKNVEKVLKRYGLHLSVALGLALREEI